MLNFTVGPVQASEAVRKIGFEQIPYFRTDEFSKTMIENEKMILDFCGAPKGSKAIFMTCSSTGSMEAAVINAFTCLDKVLIINGGSFGERFVKICKIHNIPYEEIVLEFGKALTKEKLYDYENKGFTGLLVNVNETSTGILYDVEMIGEFCKRNKMFLICDCVSSFLADSFDMDKCNADIMITGSQKALSCPPGISIIVLTDNAIERVKRVNVKSLYFDLNAAIEDGKRGQTPFTPAVGILLQINKRLKEIKELGGVNEEVERVRELAIDFRKRIEGMPFDYLAENRANGVTALRVKSGDAYEIFTQLKNQYGIWVCPNGGILAHTVFRVGHLGCITKEDNEVLVKALKDLQYKGVFN